jgi:hypothetical protein
MIGAGHADAAALRLLGDQAMRFFLKFQDEPLSAEEGVRAFEMMTNMLQRATGLQGLAAAEQLKILNEIARTDLSTTEA